MAELMRVPTIVAGAVMPDACPAGSAPGTIPVGGVVATRNAIHPGMHSADICCSMSITVLDKDADATAILDAGMKLAHFGGGGRPRGAQIAPADALLDAFDANPYPEGASQQRDRASRHDRRRQPFHLRWPPRLHGADGDGHAPRQPQARRDALQGGHGGRPAG